MKFCPDTASGHFLFVRSSFTTALLNEAPMLARKLHHFNNENKTISDHHDQIVR